MREILFRQESYDIVGACFEVYNRMGPGFLEAVYQECIEIELSRRGIPIIQQAPLRLVYRGVPLIQTYIADFVCYGKTILELKAGTELTDAHRAQTQNYLRATGLQLGLLINFGHSPDLQYERIILSNEHRENQLIR